MENDSLQRENARLRETIKKLIEEHARQLEAQKKFYEDKIKELKR